MNTSKIILLLAALCLAIPSHAQKGKWPAPALCGHIEPQVTRSVANARPNYHPVFGYTNTLPKDVTDIYPVTSVHVSQLNFGPNGRLIQTAPILSPLRYLEAFSHTKDLSLRQLAEGFYLYRLAQSDDVVFPVRRPQDILLTESYTSGFLHEIYRRLEQHSQFILTEELPSLQFLEYLQDPYMPVKSYAELAALYRKYPKHVALNEEGIPVKTEESKTARILDLYLMLSHHMKTFNNTNQGDNYTQFILTPEEYRAANKLHAAWLAERRIPNNPTPRDLIEIAYNHLESHTIPYTQAEKAGMGYQAYPNYKNTRLSRTIQEMIEEKEVKSAVSIDGSHLLENVDINHLIVLDAIMGGVDLTNVQRAKRALRAFEEFTTALEKTPQNIAHVHVLQQNLRIVFEPYIEYNHNMPYSCIDNVDALGWNAYLLLQKVNAANLVGRY
ncbi:MAG: hypothetical protein IKP96_03445 [Elusimicrobiaceae bacterium]|nr:hypothetical protein [Elusimicrobiaceae bacterium]